MAQTVNQQVFFYLPGQLHEAAQAARQAGANVVWPRACEAAVAGDFVRLAPAMADQELAEGVAVILEASHGLDEDYLRRRIASLRQQNRPVWVEVTSAERGMRCARWGAQGLVACGFEGGGFVGEESGLVLLRRLLGKTELPVVVRGGIGADSAAAVMAAGAAGYVLAEQTWLCPAIPLADTVAKRLAQFNPTDTRCLGITLGFRYRVFAMVASRRPRQLAQQEVDILADGGDAAALKAAIEKALPADPLQVDLRGELWPLGQEAGFASSLTARFGDLPGLIKGIRSHVAKSLDGVVGDFPLAKGKGIAALNGTTWPIHQGPMAQVSDTPAFAKAVADAGALPWLALGNMPTDVAEDIVDRTGDVLGDQPFGAGIIGLDANRFRDGHMTMMKEQRQRRDLLGLVAAGTAEQAMQFESANIATYLHTPTPGVLRAALQSGHRKFLWEGAEAGGHVGTLGGLALWQYGVLAIEAAIGKGLDPTTLAVVCAGGIGDAPSAAAVAALLYRLHRQGVYVGIQMGTAYLMTREAVSTGALSATYQEVADEGGSTVIMGESVNTPTRVLVNDAARQVLASETARLQSGVDLKARKHDYEEDNLGGLRAAAKGQRIAKIDEQKGAIFEDLTREEQLAQGLFHCGQGVALCEGTCTIEELHRQVTEKAHEWVKERTQRRPVRPSLSQDSLSAQDSQYAPAGSPEIIDGQQAVAIIGIGAKMPGALTAPKFWEQIVGGESAIGPVPGDRWDPSLYFDPDRNAPDKTYSQIGGWVRGFDFDRRAFRLPPKVVESIDPTQLLCLEAVREALADAGYLEADFDRNRCAVILGNALGGDLRDRTTLRIMYPEMHQTLQAVVDELDQSAMDAATAKALVNEVERRFKAQLVGVNEDSMAGELANVIAGRVAQAFDLRGPNFITDAACASSLAAVEAAVRGIRAGQFDMAVTGGADRSMGPPSFVKFSKIGALSADGSRPFDADANGFVMGEGAGILILKRLSSAIADGDEVYAIIRGVGGSSDGRGKAITAPNPRGQKMALRRAYEDAGVGPRTVSLIEAHGTSTPVGDPVEVASLQAVLAEDSAPLAADKIALGSVKSNIGHLKSAAGAAGMIKAALALKHRVLPPTLNVRRPNPKLAIDDGPIRVQTAAEPWAVKDRAVRRAGVSAFGFGGTNFHVVLEEYLPGNAAGGKATFLGGLETMKAANGSSALVSAVPSGEGIIALAAADNEALCKEFDRLVDAYESGGEAAVEPWRCDLLGGADALPAGPVRLAIAYTSPDELKAKIGRAKRGLSGKMSWRVLANQGVIFSDEIVDGKVAMLFPGQGTQYLGMLSDLRERFSVVDATFAEADEIMSPILGRQLSAIIDPDLGEIDEAAAFEALTQTEITQPAVLSADIALYRLLTSLGVEAQMVAGHSLGEYGACVAAGVLSFADALKTVAARGTEMSRATPMNGDCGLMAGISAPVEVVEPVLAAVDGYVVCANINCPGQTIIAGLTDAVKAAAKRFESMGYQVPFLPVSHAFHSKVVAAASKPLRRHLAKMDVSAPTRPILTNVTGGFYPDGPGAADAIRDLLAKQVASPVRYIDLVETMYDQGVRTFVEVGPKRAQTTFVGDILAERPHLALFTNHPKKGGVATLYEALATLWARGVWGRAAATDSVEIAEISRGGPGRDEITAAMLDVLCEKTGYDPSEIELDFELEADLGVDTVKQAEIMAQVREEFSLARDEDFRLAEYPTLARMADYVEAQLGGNGGDAGYESDAMTDQNHRQAPTISDTAQAPGADAAADAETNTEVGPDRDEITAAMLDVLCEKTGYDPSEIELDFELEADLGVDTVKQAEIMAQVREEFSLARDEDFRLAEYPTLARMADYVEAQLGVVDRDGVERQLEAVGTDDDKQADNAGLVGEPIGEPVDELAENRLAPQNLEDLPRGDSNFSKGRAYEPTKHAIEADVVVSGCAVGLPGTADLFEEATVERLLAGDNFIDQLGRDLRQAMIDKRITRLQKHADGGGELVAVTDLEEAIKLAGQGGDFDLSEWGVPSRLIEALDKTSQMAFAAGFEALRDAGLPLIPRYRKTRSGKKVTIGWTLPRAVGDETGVIFASAFAGQDALIEEMRASHDDEDYQFNHRFLLRVLGIANSRFAEFVGARGPNTKINNACASTTTAVAMAQDWIQAGRCKRVIILSADDASGDALMEWVGAGFLATGAATTEARVEDAALPFDRRRHGMIVGMGALSLIVEAGGLPESRGLEPVADVLATRFVNSAYHPTRLDVDHIAGQVSQLLSRAEADFELDRKSIADRTVFISHETYTPARGGSAAAEIAALRQAFGNSANQVVIANTKGFTGHAMGAGIEDILAMKVMQHERVPPIANFKEPDPELGDLRLSQGGDYEVDFALRLAAGFGSQLALALFRHRARGEDRLFDAAAYGKWLADISGFANPELAVAQRVLRLRQAEPTDRPPGGGQEKRQRETAPPEPNPFEYRPVTVRAARAAGGDRKRLHDALGGRKVAILAGPKEVTHWIKASLARCGADTLVLEQNILRRPEAIEEALRDVDGIVNLLGFGGAETSDALYRVVQQSFSVAQAFGARFEEAPGESHFYLTLTGQGGRLGLGDGDNPQPVCGAVAGLTKSLAREWPKAKVRAVDIAVTGHYGELGLQVLQAGLSGDRWPEVGISQGLLYEPQFMSLDDWRGDRSPDSVAPAARDVILVTGGAKGITAEICVDLARRFGCKLALVGRSELSHDDPLAVDMEAEKERLRQQLAARHDRVTPVMVRDALWPLKSQRIIARNMARMRRAGSDVEYFSCDVADGNRVRELMAQVRQRFGAIDGVIHGAGVEESKFLADKDQAGFDRVFCGKMLGAMHLWEAISDDEPDFFVGFCSVAGRFGNAGQVDYGAANDGLAKLMAQINGSTATTALAIDWTAWGGVGMAAEGGMQSLLAARGVEFLPLKNGAPMVAQALEMGLCGESLVAGELGGLGAGLAAGVSVGTGEAAADVDAFALVDAVVDRQADKVVVERVFDRQKDRFIDDHVYEGTALMPGVMGLELMVDAARLLTGEPVSQVLDVRFERALKFHDDEPLKVEAIAQKMSPASSASSGNGEQTVEVVVRSRRQSKTGRQLRPEHFRATLVCGDEPGATTAGFAIDPSGDYRRGPDYGQIYRRFFHERSFCVLESVPLLGDELVIGRGRVPGTPLVDGPKAEGFVTDPLVREMALQTVGVWGMIENGLSYLPLGIGRAVQMRQVVPGESLSIRARRRDDASEHAIAFDVEIRDAAGELVQWLEKVELIGHQKLRDDQRFGDFPELTHQVVRLGDEEAYQWLDDQGLTVRELLSDEEFEAYQRLRSADRRREFVAARVAARQVASQYARDFFGLPIAPERLSVTKADNGEPSLLIDGQRQPIGGLEIPNLSLTHSGQVAMAALAIDGRRRRVGIDRERIEARPRAFVASYFTDRERELNWPLTINSGAFETTLWSLKESVAKALGRGLELSTDEIEITALERLDDEQVQAEIRVHRRARSVTDELGGGRFVAHARIAAGFVTAVAILDARRQRRPAVTERRPESGDRGNARQALAALLGHGSGKPRTWTF